MSKQLYAAMGIESRRARKTQRPRPSRSLGRFDHLEDRRMLTLNFIQAIGLGGGAAGSVVPAAVAVDAAGNDVVVGHFSGTVNFNPAPGAPTNLTSSLGSADIFIAKYTSAGALVWARGIGETGTDLADAVAVDGKGNVYTTGIFTGTVDFDPSAGTHNLTSGGQRFEVFVLKLDSGGNFSYVTGSTGAAQQSLEQPNAIAVDAAGDAVITGSLVADLTIGGVTLNAVGQANPFVVKLGPAGTVAWAKRFPASNGAATPTPTGAGNGIALDAAGNVYTTGSFLGTFVMNPGGGTLSSTSANSQDEYISKLDQAGNIVWAKSGGGAGFDQGTGIVFDSTTNSVFAVGSFEGAANFNSGAPSGAVNTAFPDSLYLLRLDAVTGAFNLVKQSGAPFDAVNGGTAKIATDGLGKLYIGASFSGSGSIGGYPVTNTTGSSLAFVAKASTSGVFGPIATATATGAMASGGVAAGPSGVVAIAGNFTARTHFGSITDNPNGASNLYLANSKFALTLGDFDGEGKTDSAIYDQTASQFFVLESSGAALTPQFGNPAHVNIPVAGDFDGDGKADTAIYDQTSSQFFILLSGGGAQTPQFGNPAHVNIPVVGDFDGDGKTDIGIYDQTASQFFVLLSGGGAKTPQFGDPSHINIPVGGDFDGDGKTDIGIYDQTASQFFVLLSGGGAKIPQFGNPAHTNVPVAGDFDADGKTDTAIYDQTSSQFFVLLSGGGAKTPQFGNPAHVNIPVAGDFDGDGQTDTAIYDQTASQYFVLLSGGGALTPQFGNPAHTNVPLPSVYLIGLRSRSMTRSAALGGSFDLGAAARTFNFNSTGSPSSASPTPNAAPAIAPGRGLVNQSPTKPWNEF
jgi:hypothetical protein